MVKRFLFISIYAIFVGSSLFSQESMPPHDFDEHAAEHHHADDSVKRSSTYSFMTYGDNLDTFHVAVDTALHGLHVHDPIYRRSISNSTLGNLGSPYQSNIYFDRPEVHFLFSDVYDAYFLNYKNLPYVNTRTPFAVLSYKKGGPRSEAEEVFSVLFSQNINKDVNFGAYFDLIYARGLYTGQSVRHRNYGAFASYNKPKYNAYLNIGAGHMENRENGGFGDANAWDDLIVSQPSDELAKQPRNYSVRIDDARSYLKNQFVTFNHQYNIGIMRQVNRGDTILEEFVPALNLVHQFKYEADAKQYEDNNAVTSFYDTAYIHNAHSLDSARHRRISNRFGLYLDEAINRFGKFGAGAYLQMDNNYLLNTPWISIEDSSLRKNHSSLLADNNKVTLDSSRLDFIHAYKAYRYADVTFGGSIFKREGTHFFFDADAQLCFSGHNAGDWRVKGVLRQVFPKMKGWELSAHADFKRETANYFLQHYYANNFWWDNDFDPSFTQKLGGKLKIPSINVELSLDVDNKQKPVYFDENALPAQFDANLTVMALRLKKDFELGRLLVWENDVVYQETSSETVLPLPTLAVYSNFYFRPVLFKVLHMELGFDCRYHTSFYAPGYMPATGRFYNQREVKIGDYPLVNVYADFFLRRMRFYLMFQHVNEGWMPRNYFSAAHYAHNPRLFKIGLQWTFYD